MTRTEIARTATPLLLFALAAGCGGAPAPTYPVQGTVRVDGVPLEHGVVQFETVTAGEPDDVSYTARAQIGPDGRYRLSTFGEDDGAVAGRHRVVVAQEPPAAADLYEPGTEPAVAAIPPEYGSPRTTPLEVEVEAGANTIDLELRSR